MAPDLIVALPKLLQGQEIAIRPPNPIASAMRELRKDTRPETAGSVSEVLTLLITSVSSILTESWSKLTALPDFSPKNTHNPVCRYCLFRRMLLKEDNLCMPSLLRFPGHFYRIVNK
jgi:hypothetical protein